MLTRRLCLATVWLTPLVLAAQPPGPDPLAENLFPPELVMQHQKAINLTDPQKASIRADLVKTQTRFTELQWQLQDAMEGLVALLKQSPTDEAQVMNILDKVLGFEREIKRSQIGLLVRIKNVLTAEQQAKLHRLQAAPPR